MNNSTKKAQKRVKTYELPDLTGISIDAWVDGISAMDDIDDVRKEAYEMAGIEFDPDADPELCPGELEAEYTKLAEKYRFRFDKDGRIVSYDLKTNGNK